VAKSRTRSANYYDLNAAGSRRGYVRCWPDRLRMPAYPKWNIHGFTGAWTAGCLRNGARRENLHAVREMITNAADKQVLTNSKDVEVS
jgi:hypothetical protein